jgi:hypothetical protein
MNFHHPIKITVTPFQAQFKNLSFDPTLPIRTLTIEAHGDFWKKLIKPKIRLTGYWLERAGFRPGNRVRVICVAPGVIELRSYDYMIPNGTT